MKISISKKCVCLVASLLSSLVLVKILTKIIFNNDADAVTSSRNYQKEIYSAQQEILDWKYQIGSRNAFEVVNPDIVTVYVQPQDVYLRKDIFDTRLSILILVSTLSEAKLQRNVIRKTWASWISEKEISNKYSIKILFFFFFTGLPKSSSSLQILELEKENSQFQDVIVDDFTEHFCHSSLTPKTTRMLKWCMQTFQNNSRTLIHAPDFFIKSDHDVFINIPNLGAFVSSILANTRTSSNSFSSESASLTSSSSSYEDDYPQKFLNFNSSLEEQEEEEEKEELRLSLPPWYFIGGHVYSEPLLESGLYSDLLLSPEFWFGQTFSHYPSYVAGLMFILSGNIIPLLYKGIFFIPLFPFEDIYLFGLVGKQYLNLTFNNVPEIQIRLLESPLNIIQSIPKLQKIIAIHPVEPEKHMKSVFASVHTNN